MTPIPPVTPLSILEAKQAQARERELVWILTGLRIVEDGQILHAPSASQAAS